VQSGSKIIWLWVAYQFRLVCLTFMQQRTVMYAILTVWKDSGAIQQSNNVTEIRLQSTRRTGTRKWKLNHPTQFVLIKWRWVYIYVRWPVNQGLTSLLLRDLSYQDLNFQHIDLLCVMRWSENIRHAKKPFSDAYANKTHFLLAAPLSGKKKVWCNNFRVWNKGSRVWKIMACRDWSETGYLLNTLGHFASLTVPRFLGIVT